MRRHLPLFAAAGIMALLGASFVWVGPDRTSAPPPSSSTSSTLDVAGELARLEGEIVRQGDDQRDLRQTVTSLERASRSRARPRTVARGAPATGDVWARLRQCESGGNYAANTGNGYHGAYQASHSTWGGYAGYSDAHLAPPAVQDEWARALHARRGWQPWPACSRKLGLR